MKNSKLALSVLITGLVCGYASTYAAAEELNNGAVGPEMCGYTDKILLGAGKPYLPPTIKLVNVSGDIKFEQIDESSFQIKSPHCGSGNVRVAYTYTNINAGTSATCELTIDDGAFKNQPQVRDVKCDSPATFKYNELNFDQREHGISLVSDYKIYFGRG